MRIVKEKERKKKDMRAKDDGWMGKFETINEPRSDDKHVLVFFIFFLLLLLLRQQQTYEKYLAE